MLDVPRPEPEVPPIHEPEIPEPDVPLPPPGIPPGPDVPPRPKPGDPISTTKSRRIRRGLAQVASDD
jgi:hypothetical protein